MTADEYDKESIHDFALWKMATKEELDRGVYYDTTWGKGRPGWHIECSVMSKELLGETIDIHAGGEDLVFPHHENEVAQSEALTGKPFVRYWMHMRFLMINRRKMSKSLGNYVSFDEVLSKHSPDAFRYFYISTHYRRPLNYTESALKNADNSTARLKNTLDLIENSMKDPDINLDYGDRERRLMEVIKTKKTEFEEAMDDDFNSPLAIVALHAISRAINNYLTGPANKGVLYKGASIYRKFLGVMGLFEKRSSESDPLVEKLITTIAEIREELRKEKNYELSDLLRYKLKNAGVELIDTPEGTKWKIEMS
jgi:cysteinyl-tRNA synthetase